MTLSEAGTTIYLGTEAASKLIRYCQTGQRRRFLLVSDFNTYAALGRQVRAGLARPGWQVRTLVHASQRIFAT
jgi:glycerol dehydrogenase-like iron-containing ADH family enzyme